MSICKVGAPPPAPPKGSMHDVSRLCDVFDGSESSLRDLVAMGNPVRIVANILDLTTQETLVKLAHLYEHEDKRVLYADHFVQMRKLQDKEREGVARPMYDRVLKDAETRFKMKDRTASEAVKAALKAQGKLPPQLTAEAGAADL